MCCWQKLSKEKLGDPKWKSLSCVPSLWPHGLTVHGIFQDRTLEWVACSLLQGIFPTQGLNPGLLHCRQIVYHLSHEGSPCRWVIINKSLFSLSTGTFSSLNIRVGDFQDTFRCEIEAHIIWVFNFKLVSKPVFWVLLHVGEKPKTDGRCCKGASEGRHTETIFTEN